nr:hypothetical protein Iba_chr13aCG3740 [Ipomoea batatas]
MVNFHEKIQTVIPTREAIKDLETDQLSHMTNDLFCRAKAAENVVRREVNPLKESLAAKDKELSERYRPWKVRLIGDATGVQAALTESLNEKDLATIMEIMPDEVPDPRPMPYADPTPVVDPTAPVKD